MKPVKPHYVYIRHEMDGGRTLVIMSREQQMQEQELTFDSAMHFAHAFFEASKQLHKTEITRLGNKEEQPDMFAGVKDEPTVYPSRNGPSDNAGEGGIPTDAPVRT